ncbi:photosynthetic reaction center subunit H [Erythrobacter sp. EC-HK427]|uniref:photosynthetic reaction center subunit H n=1 Tax=Erythrobacter sp. EC-HK427 TaxID=2038396 RepID=UPI0012590831|nr:photosynthetic reaction center subunit H [Erythrobacter sp. EC-HK427]VVT11102.1 Reaction center protein H chain [Erythrobacter sp. EC-HK427]
MADGNIVGSIDLAEIALSLFFLFFLALVFWLRREDRREGYPLEDAVTGHVGQYGGPLSTAAPKTFKLPFGKGTVSYPRSRREGREPVEIAARRRENFAGAPYFPTGNPLADGVGPASYAQRQDYPDMTAHGTTRIVPMSSDADFGVAHFLLNIDPRGLDVIGADKKVAGKVRDLWVDRSEHIVRYLEVDIGEKTVLAPMAMAVVKRGYVEIDAINAADYAGVPALASATEITRLEEERVIGYFGGGYLYAKECRQEPLI